MSVKQIALSAALLGNGASAVKLAHQVQRGASGSKPEQVACIKFVDQLILVQSVAERKLRQGNKEPKDKATLEEYAALTTPFLRMQYTASQVCEKHGGKTLRPRVGIDETHAGHYNNKLQEIVEFFANTDAKKEGDLPRMPKPDTRAGARANPVEPTLGHQGYDYKKHLAEFMDNHNTFAPMLMFGGDSNTDRIGMVNSFVNACCAEKTLDYPATQQEKLDMGAIERAQAQADQEAAEEVHKKKEPVAAAEVTKAEEAEAKAAADKKAKEDAEKCC
ncbi:unnamed protein product [Amoebophrya sp. A25]|nr:unnamed protein product [Amoebophrya sp. A25]|eukprot:GSA25T00010695001.1